MGTNEVRREVAAPADLVFEVVSDIHRFREVIDAIVDVEMHTEGPIGVGTRFRETRLMNGREASTTLEITEYQPPRRVRLVADEHGTVWDTTFDVEAAGPQSCVLVMRMEGRAHKILAKLMNPFIRGMIQRAVEGDMDAVKLHCEAVSRSSEGSGSSPAP